MMSATIKILVNFVSVQKPTEVRGIFCFSGSIIEHIRNVVIKLLIVKRNRFPGQQVSLEKKLSVCLIFTGDSIHLRQKLLPMSNITLLIYFHCYPGVSAGVKRHTAHFTKGLGS